MLCPIVTVTRERKDHAGKSWPCTDNKVRGNKRHVYSPWGTSLSRVCVSYPYGQIKDLLNVKKRHVYGPNKSISSHIIAWAFTVCATEHLIPNVNEILMTPVSHIYSNISRLLSSFKCKIIKALWLISSISTLKSYSNLFLHNAQNGCIIIIIIANKQGIVSSY